jgi:predicted nucleotidyltransferase
MNGAYRMNSASQWRQEFARRIAPAYAANPNVAAIVLGGSSARGHADRYSDIEIGIFWHQPPTEAERQAAVARRCISNLRNLWMNRRL